MTLQFFGKGVLVVLLLLIEIQFSTGQNSGFMGGLLNGLLGAFQSGENIRYIATGKCPAMRRSENPSEFYYMEHAGDKFMPGQPRHLLAVGRNAYRTPPVEVNENLHAYVYNPPPRDVMINNFVRQHKCGNFCNGDKSCGNGRNCCLTPCGYSCFKAIYNV